MPYQAFATSAKKLRDLSEVRGRATASGVAAKFALAPEGAENPRQVTASIRADRSSNLNSDRAPLREIRANIDLIRTMISCFEKCEPLPPSFPEPFAAHVRTVILGMKAGLGNSVNLIAQLGAAADYAEAIYRDADKGFRRFESATAIAINKHTVDYLKRCGRREDRKVIALLERRIAKQTASHRARWPTRNAHRAAKLAKAK